MLSRLHCVRLLVIAFVTLGMCGMSVLLVHASRVGPAAPQDSQLPKEIAGLMPRAAVEIRGDWRLAEGLGLGSLTARLPANHPCTGDELARILIDIVYYRDKEMGSILQTWRSMEGEQAEKKKQYEEQIVTDSDSLRPRLIRIGPVKTEDGPGGKILYYDYVVDCSEGKHQERPEVSLFAITHTDNYFVKIEISGYLTGDEAKAFANEVMTNISR